MPANSRRPSAAAVSERRGLSCRSSTTGSNGWRIDDMIIHMKQLLVQFDDQTSALLERIAPGRSRKRSEFIRRAVARALQDELERRTRAAYERSPDEPATFDPGEWASRAEAVHPVKVRPGRRAARKTKANRARAQRRVAR
jgi:Arc/MetJ-type ribon-helix-helix transcriptional regulator